MRATIGSMTDWGHQPTSAGTRPMSAKCLRLLSRRDLSLPRPATVDFEHQRPTEKRSDYNQTSKQTKACERQLYGYRLHNIGSHQHFESKQERSTYSDFILVVIPR